MKIKDSYLKCISIIMAVAVLLFAAVGCGAGGTDKKDNEGSGIEDGTYEITVDSSSSMFRVVKCILEVKDGDMNATMTMSGQGYGKLFMGTGEEALSADESMFIPFEIDDEGAKNFTVPVEALDEEIDCAAWSIKKEQWYDRVLVFKSDGISAESSKAEDGKYSAETVISGGSGRAAIEETHVEISEGNVTAAIRWSSPHYEYMIVDGERYNPVNSSGNSVFEIPAALDKDMPVSALTSAMSEPHLIDYVLRIESDTLKKEK